MVTPGPIAMAYQLSITHNQQRSIVLHELSQQADAIFTMSIASDTRPRGFLALAVIKKALACQ